MLLMIDNYDSFTYNLVQYFGELGAEVEVHRNDCITVDEVVARKPRHIVLSPAEIDTRLCTRFFRRCNQAGRRQGLRIIGLRCS